MAAAYLSAFTINGGVPLLTRKFGNLKSLPYPLLASLNGVAMFGKTNDVTLLSTITNECQFLWRDYHNSIRLIIAVPFDTLSQVHLHRLLDSVFQAMILIVGLDDLVAQRHVERTKRDLRAAFPLIDRLLESVHPGDNLTTFGDLVGASDVIAFPEASQVQNLLDAFIDSADSTYGSVMCDHRIVCATKNWWSLHPDEIGLLAEWMASDQFCNLRDIPVFLPVKSPTVPFRLIICNLIPRVTLCALCGPVPSLPEIEALIQRHFKQSYPLMASLQSIQPRSFPPIQIDNCILAFMLVNLEKRRLLSSLLPHYDANKDSSTKHQLSPSRKADILRTFYRTTVGQIFPETFVPSPYAVDQNTGETHSNFVPHVKLDHPVSETYLNFEYFKCHAIRHLQFQFFAIFIAAVPNHSMRNIAHRTVQQILKDKNFSIVA